MIKGYKRKKINFPIAFSDDYSIKRPQFNYNFLLVNIARKGLMLNFEM